jgi:hypothetical protein
MLYSFKNKYPKSLPNRIVLSDGTTRTDKSTFTLEQIQDAGYVEVEDPPIVQYPNKLEWSGTKWVVLPPDMSDIEKQKANIREQCLHILFDTDYKVIKAFESGTQVDPYYVQYRQEIRDLYNSVDELEDVWNVVFPTLHSDIVAAQLNINNEEQGLE